MPEDWNPTLLRDIEITTEQAQQDPTAVEGNPLFPEMENFVLLEEVPFRKKWDQFKANRIVDRVDENTMAIIEMEGSGGGGISDTHNVAVRIPQPGYYQPNQVIPFPPLGPGRGIHVQILGHTGAPIKTAVITFGGPLGVRVRHGSWIFGWVSSSGGSYHDVAYKYVIVGEVLGTSVIRVDELPNPEVTTPDEGALYLVNSTGFMYVWNPDTESFQNVGEVIPGTYVSQSEFRDEFDVVVVPEPGRFYYDNTSEIYYRWNGSVYIDIAYSEGGTTISLSHLTENSVPRYSPQTGRLEDSEIFSRAGKVGIGTMEPTEALEVNGRAKVKGITVDGDVRGKGFIGRSISANIASSYAIDLNDMAEHYILTMTDNTSISFSNMISDAQSVVITLTVTGNYSMTLPAFLKASPNNDSYLGTENNEIVINIKKGGLSPVGYYTLTNIAP